MLAIQLDGGRKGVQRLLDRLTTVPVDIEPAFATADSLVVVK